MKTASKLTITLSFFSATLLAQNGPKWGTNGNATSTGDFLGSTNNQPLIFKTNNTQVGMFNTDGSLNLNSLNNGTKGLVLYDGNGTLFQLPFTHNSNQMLLGDGTWGNIPNTSNLWLETNGNISYTHGYVGIGTAFPVFPLDVIGDARISNNLYVGGGIVITDKVRATGDVKTGRLEADTIKMDIGKMIYGETKIEGDAKLKYKLDVTGISNFNDDVYLNRAAVVNNNFTVGGNSNLNGNVRLQNGFTFDGTSGIKMVPANGSSPNTFLYGNTITSGIMPVNCAAAPQGPASHVFNGGIQVYDSNYPTDGGLLNIQSWYNSSNQIAGSSIDASAGGNTGAGGLLINFFCGRPTYLNTGQYGGTVFMGDKVDMGKSLKIGWTESGIIDLNTSIEVNQNENDANGVKVQTWNGSIKAFSIFNPTNRKSALEIYGDGRAYFGINRIKSNHAHANTPYQFDGKVGCKELVVVDPTKWADFVFEKNYELLPLNEVEAFYLTNKHLPSVPSEKEVKENGINTADMDAVLLQKIEELTLYVVQQQKEIEALKKEIKK